MHDRSSLSASDRFRFNVFWFAAYNRFDFAFHQYQKGRLDPQLWAKLDYEIPLYLSLPGALSWWKQDKVRFSEQFAAYVDTRIAEFEMPDAFPSIRQPHED